MIKLGVIGTHWITAQFISAAVQTGDFKLSAVFSRRQQRAIDFIEEVKQADAVPYDDLDDFLSSGIEAVYIASPNSIHFQQAAAAIKKGVDVIVEKPSFSNPSEFDRIEELLKKHPQVRLFEAARNYHDKNFSKIKKAVARLDQLQGANLVYAKYSSRFDAYLNDPDNPPNVLNKNFSGGALYDLGVYPIYDAVGLFGYPRSVYYKADLLKNGTDGSGWINLGYKDFTVGILISKSFTSYAPSEIFGLKQTISIDNPAELDRAELVRDDDHKDIIALGSGDNPLLDEAEDFAAVLKDRDSSDMKENYSKWFSAARQVNKLLYEIRQAAGIVFPAD
ncbi:Gfo/Idh/MocA family protein [Oenococcus alcoholitolerans]|uniref:Gfo/Idh/MocA family protein n=1 Tax=Oenococcus alcoholitolerans TaxID=931074 RepID=UPI003F6F6DD1